MQNRPGAQNTHTLDPANGSVTCASFSGAGFPLAFPNINKLMVSGARSFARRPNSVLIFVLFFLYFFLYFTRLSKDRENGTIAF